MWGWFDGGWGIMMVFGRLFKLLMFEFKEDIFLDMGWWLDLLSFGFLFEIVSLFFFLDFLIISVEFIKFKILLLMIFKFICEVWRVFWFLIKCKIIFCFVWLIFFEKLLSFGFFGLLFFDVVMVKFIMYIILKLFCDFVNLWR